MTYQYKLEIKYLVLLFKYNYRTFVTYSYDERSKTNFFIEKISINLQNVQEDTNFQNEKFLVERKNQSKFDHTMHCDYMYSIIFFSLY